MRPRSRLKLVAFAALAALGCGRERAVGSGSVFAARALGLAHLQVDRLDSAEIYFKRVVAIAPDEALGHANLGVTYLRGGRLQEAEAAALRARSLDSTSSTIALLLARVYGLTNRSADARALLERLARDGTDDPVALYALAQMDTSPSLAKERVQLLNRILSRNPTNVAVRLALLDAYVSLGRADSATGALEEIRRLPPEPPREALVSYSTALHLLRAGRLADVGGPLKRFKHAMELTPAYQASMTSVKGIEGPMAGRPVLTFSPAFNIAQRAASLGGVITDAARFADVTADIGFAGPDGGIRGAGGGAKALAVGDVDGDGLEDIFASVWDEARRAPTARLYRAARGRFDDATAASGITLADGAVSALFADYDNDGRLDLVAIDADQRTRLFRNAGAGRFEDVTAKAGLGGLTGVARALCVDLEHDGDLDLLAFGPQGLRAARNNADGSFTDATAEFGLSTSGEVSDVVFADFNGDGRMDLFVSRARESGTLFRNAGARRFENATAASGLAKSGVAGVAAVGDVNNDGAFDLFMAASGADGPAIWLNRGDGAFARDGRRSLGLAALRGMRLAAAQFADIDNDGWLDLLAVGSPEANGSRGTVLLHNDGRGGFEDRSALLPLSSGSSVSIAVFDIERDGDMDLAVGDAAGGLRVLRNDGGNANLFVQVRLAALRTGSGKNNDFGIGAKLELRVGDLVQTRVVTGPITHFGLGAHLKADVLRVEWPNGVPQVIHFPGSDQDVLENEVLKSSCGFLYGWDGTGFRFITDVMWRSALGMPLGIMGSNTAWAPPGASQEYLRIPGSALQPRGGRYVLQLTEELWETSYTDEIQLLAVDHPDSVAVFVDERFVPPGPITLRMYLAARARPPRTAVDDRGNDMLAALLEKDDVYVSNLVPLEYQGLVERHDLVLDLGDAAGSAGTLLILRGWIYPTDASINVALSQQSRLKPIMPVLEVRDASGAWRQAADIGFPSGKDKTIVVDLAGKFPTRDHRVRIRTNMQIYWDQAFVATDAAGAASKIAALPLLSADLHNRGTSRMYRKGGRYGPHWFDYDSVITAPVWRPISGAFTRFGDVRALLQKADDQYIVMAPGDETTLQFAAPPPPPAGWTRDFLLYSDGWIKDADLNTALGNTVGPLPFHAIKQYPYAPGESYPSDAASRRYLREYNTRVVKER